MSVQNSDQQNNYSSIKLLIPVISIYFIVYCAVYSVQDFIFLDLRRYTTNDNTTLSLYTIYCVKFFIASIFSAYADSRRNHNKLLMFGMFLFSLALFLFTIFSKFKEYCVFKFRILYLMVNLVLYFASLGIIFPMLEALGINYLKNINLYDKFYIIKIFCSLGHMVAYIPGIVIGKGGYLNIATNIHLNTLRNIFGATYSILGILIIYFSKIEYKMKFLVFKKEYQRNNNQHIPLIYKIVNLFSSSYSVFMCSVLIIGIIRATTQALSRLYHKSVGISTNQGSSIACLRLIFEIAIFFVLGRFKKRKLLYFFFTICVFFANLRPFLLFLIDKNNSETNKLIKLIAAELSKGFFCSFFNYSTARVADDISPIEYKTLAQGICFSVYSGFSSLPFVIIGLIVYNISWSLPQSTKLEDISDILLRKKMKIMFLIISVLGLLGWISSLFLFIKRGIIKNSRN